MPGGRRLSIAERFPKVQGRCPACHGDSLFLAEGGHVTCASLDCPIPDAASLLLEGDPAEAPHVDRDAARSGVPTGPVRVHLPGAPEDLEAAVREAAEHPQPLMIIPSPPPRLSLGQLHAAADRIRERTPPPSPLMTPGRYVSAECLHALADALDGIAEDG